jgi:hypothetical protein
MPGIVMKKIFFFSLVVFVIAAACSRKMATTKEPVIPQREPSITPGIRENTQSTITSPSETLSLDEATISMGKNVYEAKCGKCHDLKNVKAYSTQNWVGILEFMAPKAKLSEIETRQVAAYVKANAKK